MKALRAVNRSLVGGEGSLADTFGLDAPELATLLNQCRDQALGGGKREHLTGAPGGCGQAAVGLEGVSE